MNAKRDGERRLAFGAAQTRHGARDVGRIGGEEGFGFEPGEFGSGIAFGERAKEIAVAQGRRAR